MSPNGYFHAGISGAGSLYIQVRQCSTQLQDASRHG